MGTFNVFLFVFLSSCGGSLFVYCLFGSYYNLSLSWAPPPVTQRGVNLPETGQITGFTAYCLRVCVHVCLCVCVRPYSSVCECVLLHPLRHSCCESAPLFLSWVTHPAVAWLLQSGESFLLRLCLCGWMGPDIYSGSGVSGQIMYVFVCMRAFVCVRAPFHPTGKSWWISFSTSCC